ncbi:hypothetical protein P262_03519 [Cronobacter malonaticus]|uniref:Uncharacterized protein n=1 Tax=Cronobacter malonaticus TaxID=413503 RepID=V5U0H3_9ENTR|nr:hypothetical protein P262_03519 [Cronobacter malonaticus]
MVYCLEFTYLSKVKVHTLSSKRDTTTRNIIINLSLNVLCNNTHTAT